MITRQYLDRIKLKCAMVPLGRTVEFAAPIALHLRGETGFARGAWLNWERDLFVFRPSRPLTRKSRDGRLGNARRVLEQVVDYLVPGMTLVANASGVQIKLIAPYARRPIEWLLYTHS
jgi:hypothetical protein